MHLTVHICAGDMSARVRVINTLIFFSGVQKYICQEEVKTEGSTVVQAMAFAIITVGYLLTND
jgi:hypothetical protein